MNTAAAAATARDSPAMRIVLNIPAAAPAFSTGTVLTAALSITENASPTPTPKTSSGRAVGQGDVPVFITSSPNAPAAMAAGPATRTVRAGHLAVSQGAVSGTSRTGAVIGTSSTAACSGLVPPPWRKRGR